jgi:hypothetical protein
MCCTMVDSLRHGGMSCSVVSCRVVSCRVVSCRVVSCRVVSCRVCSSYLFRRSLVVAAWKAVTALANDESFSVIAGHTFILGYAMAIVKGQALEVGPVGTACRRACASL